MTSTMNHQDHMELMCQFVPSQGEISKPKRRRKKNKSSENGNTVESKKRKLSAEQVHMLEVSFGNEHKLDSERKDRLASELRLDPRQVAVWFQNRRARWKNKKLEDEFSDLKKLHQTDLLEKSRLQSEVMKLKEQLIEAEKEIQGLTERVDNGGLSNSPSSSLSMETIIMDPPFFGEFGVERYDDHIFYMPETNYINGMVEWVNLYV